MKNKSSLDRRAALKSIAIGSAALAMGQTGNAMEKEHALPAQRKGNINQSVCQWCFGDLPLETLAQKAKEMGLVGIDLVGAEGWDTLKKYGLISTMCYGDLEGRSTRNLSVGWCDKKNHADLIPHYLRHIKMVAEAGWTNLICFSGNSRGIDRETGMNNCVEGLQQIIPTAEKYGVILQMELLNSKVDHNDYMCDNSVWGVELCKRLDSDNFKLLYDIYHMQIMEGDVIHTIRDNHKYYGHYHTAGVPGRHELDENQELFYPAIMEAIVATGFKGYVAQEFIPANRENDGLDSLRKAIATCDV
ncbi:TIM barrel protein [Flavobacteriaceae bacterium]|nr:TIM barrel protein [Flavobacteriaceae bacterium]